MELKSIMVGLVPFAAMVMVESLDVGLSTLSKAAMSKGMSHFVFVVYSNALATLLLLPSAFFFHRSKRPPLTLSLLWKFFLLGLIGITVAQNCVFTALNYSSPTLASAMSNLIPAFTFLLAVIFRMEKFELRSTRSQMKIIGTLVSITGALVVTLYKGPPIGSLSTQSSPLPSTDHINLPQLSYSHMLKPANNWVLGGFLFAIACLSVAIWNTSQAAILKHYPSEMTVVGFCCLFGTTQCTVVSLIAEREHPNAWILSPDIELLSVISSAVFGNIVIYCTQTWCIRKRGPVFVATFKPLGIAIAALLSVIFLGDMLHVGSIIGALVIVTGFYAVIWAESKEDKDDVHEIERLPFILQEVTSPAEPQECSKELSFIAGNNIQL